MTPKGGILAFRWQRKLGWWLIGILCAIPVLRWLTYVPLEPRLSGFYGQVSSVAKIAGFIGIMLYAINLILATRLRLFENIFGGLNRLFIAHHLVGALALIALAFHPTLMALRYVTISLHDAALQVLPHLSPLNKNAWALNFGSIAFTGMVTLLIITFFVKLPYQVWFWTHRFLGVFFFFAGLHVLLIPSDVAVDNFLRYYILAFVILGVVAYAYRSLLGRILIRKYPYAVEDVRVLSGNVAEITMRPTHQPLSFEPGQFVFIRFLKTGSSGVSKEWHPFSVSSSPSDKTLSIDVKALGDYTNTLLKLKPGATAEIEGAYGKFSYHNYPNHNHIWIAGGIGITPFLSMARSLQKDARAKDLHVDMYYSVKSKEELVDYEALRAVANYLPQNFKLIPHVSNDNGRLTAELVAKQSGGLAGKDVYICGPAGMMKDLKNQFVTAGVPKRAIHSEEFAMT